MIRMGFGTILVSCLCLSISSSIALAQKFDEDPAPPTSLAPKDVNPKAEKSQPESVQQEPGVLPRNTSVVYALSFGILPNGKAVGGCHPVRVTVGGGEPGRVRVGFFESQVGASGDQWKASGWMAAVTAAQLTDFNPLTMQVAYDVEGNTDGPSAGGLLTVGLLAAVRGDQVRQDMAMTGTINPDGMIGPVGGIAHKLEGAAAAGKKTVLIPEGIRNQKNHSGDYVNLMVLGEQLGIEVRPVLDIYEAYEVMTGVELPRPPRADAPEVSQEMSRKLARRLQSWISMTATAQKYYKDLSEDGPEESLDAMIDNSNELLESGTDLLEEGLTAAAYDDFIFAALEAYTALEYGKCRISEVRRGMNGLFTRLKTNQWLQTEIDKTATALRYAEPRTLNQLTMYLMSCEAFFEALAFQDLARSILTIEPDDSDRVWDLALDAAYWQLAAWLDCKIAIDYLELQKEYGGMPIPEDAPIIQTATFYRHAANANLNTFDSLFLDKLSTQLKLSKSDTQGFLALKDEYYGLLFKAQRTVIPKLADYFGEGPQLKYALLAASLDLHRRGAMLVAKYYSLDADFDEYLNITEVGRERTFNAWLDESKEQAQRNIALLGENGIDTTSCAQLFEAAQISRNRELGDQINALEYYFQINIMTRVLRRIAGIRVTDE
ncbi:S16 family serine protease [Calycomorphotria hydatis]|uniref:endopeptidase La n=1 Tax=Calycomorphotria hydatis TaxID=2528027 RepID=A0A517T6J5_9PLAN|nr:S16 family serine protease [Calycomorphotria hydatis]QDT63996.1 Lon protease [Calycomorphotria hydatis]